MPYVRKGTRGEGGPMYVRELISVSQAARIIGVSSSVTKDLMLLGTLEYVALLNGKIYVYQDSVLDFKKQLEAENVKRDGKTINSKGY